MARGNNIRSRKKIAEALETIHSPFTSPEMAAITGLTAKKVHSLLREHDGVDKEPVNRSLGIRCQWRVRE